MRKFQHPLMSNNFDQSDFNPVIKLLKKKNTILTQSINVRHFEKMWSKWLGVKYSVFVNSMFMVWSAGVNSGVNYT